MLVIRGAIALTKYLLHGTARKYVGRHSCVICGIKTGDRNPLRVVVPGSRCERAANRARLQTPGCGARKVGIHAPRQDQLTVKVWAFEVPPPPPLVELKTVTWAVPAAAMLDAGIVTVSRVEETNVVARVTPFQRTTDTAK